ncbi:nucleotide exchange factor GrpE [Calycomorphotria hydatis]|uniref:Protein GrpE n=1 Tax=Calycomorphotria hydatis TaxID=2528027 RepID=A0A517TE13_9PLAN|nr:nucleotide exchange factor GrpE [Calycomorphotria hydatis]QDT66607.1 heat shock protein GrpE [Calycomorphotria hydatis]
MSEEQNEQTPEEETDAVTEESSGSESSPSLEEQLEATRAERDEQKDKLLRATAEMENFKKRVERERAEEYKYRASGVARDLLPVIDNLKRALDAAGKSGNLDELVTGVEMVAKQFEDALASHGVTKIASEGTKFDPNLHEALTQVPSAEHEPMTVMQVIESGYQVHDRVLRPSKVIVSAEAPPSE